MAIDLKTLRPGVILLGTAGGGGGGGTWGFIVGTITDQTDLVNYVAAQVASVEFISGTVATYNDLPTAVPPALDSAYLVHTAQGTWPFSRKEAGVYIRTNNAGVLADWTFAGVNPDRFSSLNFRLYDNGDNTKLIKYDLSGITSGNTRTATFPDADFTFVGVNTTQSLTNKKLGSLTTNGLVTTSGGDGTLSITAPGTGVLTALGVNIGSAGAFVVLGGALGTPSSGVATNLTGTAAGLTAGNVTTNANLTGDVTSVGNATTIANNAVSNAKAAQMANSTIKGRTTAGTGNAEDMTAAQTNAILQGDGSVDGAGGFRNIPQNSKSAAYTTVLADAGKHIYHPSADTTARNWTIDSNGNVAYPIGTTLTFVNDSSAGVITIKITADTMVLAGTGSTGDRTLAANGIATAIKMTSTRWQINGTGLT